MKKLFHFLSKHLWIIGILVGLAALAVVFLAARREAETPALYITEICAKNKTLAYDDNGNYGADYIELFNASNKRVSLSGYALSDKNYNLKKFAFEDGYIEPGETIIVWCSENIDDTSIYDKDYRPVNYHQDEFSLAPGDKVFLTYHKEILENIIIPRDLPKDQVYACFLSDLTDFSITDASPFEVLESASCVPSDNVDTSLSAPSFSETGGWYDEAFVLELSSEDGEIYYTTDGTEPDEASFKYEGGIVIENRSSESNLYADIEDISLKNEYLPEFLVDKGTVVKAVCVKNGKRSPVATRTYFVGLSEDPEYLGLSVMELTVDPDDFFDYYDGIYRVGNVYETYKNKFDEKKLDRTMFFWYANYAKEGLGWERPCHMEFFDSSHNYVFSQDIGIRIHGGWSTSFNQKSFNLYARPEYDGSTYLNYDFFGKATNKLMLRAGGFRDVYATKIRDAFNQSLAQDRSTGAQQSLPVMVFLNGEFWGFYFLQETVSEGYISSTYQVDADNILITKNAKENRSDENSYFYDEIVEFAATHDLSKEGNYRKVEKKIDLQSYIDYMAFEIYVANCDSVGNNFARWRVIEEEPSEYGDMKWRFLLYDTDDSAGMVPKLTNYKVDSFTEGHYAEDPLGKNGSPLFKALIQNSEFKERFVISFMDMANHNFNYERVSELLNQMAAQCREGVIASQMRFRGNYAIDDYSEIDTFQGTYDEETYSADIKVIDDFYKNRFDYIVKYMKKDLELKGDLRKITVKASDPSGCILSINTISEIESGFSGKYYSDYPVTLSCETLNGYEFVSWQNAKGEILSTAPELQLDLTTDTEAVAVLRQVS